MRGAHPRRRPAAGRLATRIARRAAALAAGGALAVGLSGCLVGSAPTVTVRAVFSDVGTLASGAQVKLADVPVGHVTGIGLAGSRARVTMSIDRSAHVPADVVAKLARATILGERYIELDIPAHRRAPLLADGATIARTAVVPGVERVIGESAQVFGAISTAELSQIIAAGGQGFIGQAASLRRFLNDISAVTAGYASRTAQIRTVVQSLDQLGTTLAPTSGPDAQAISTLSQTVSILASDATRFESLLQSLDDVSVQGNSILSTYFPQVTDQLRALGAVSAQLAEHQQDLANLLRYLPEHDATMSSVTRNDFLQILNNLIVCGIPGGGSSPTPAFTCNGAGSGGSGG
ncbi:MAG: MCE family protein [Acidimicrobiales bacterium]